MSQKYTACHVLLLKYRPEKLLDATACECYPGMASGNTETEHYHLTVPEQNYYLPASFQLKLKNVEPWCSALLSGMLG